MAWLASVDDRTRFKEAVLEAGDGVARGLPRMPSRYKVNAMTMLRDLVALGRQRGLELKDATAHPSKSVLAVVELVPKFVYSEVIELSPQERAQYYVWLPMCRSDPPLWPAGCSIGPFGASCAYVAPSCSVIGTAKKEPTSWRRKKAREGFG